MVVSNISYGLGAGAAFCAIVAGVYAYRASATEPKAAWDYDPELRPKNFEQHNFGMVNALERALWLSSQSGKKAAFWGMASAVLGLLAAIFAWMS
jgi:hypothetical protein